MSREESDVAGLTADERAVIRGADNLYRGVERVIAERVRAAAVAALREAADAIDHRAITCDYSSDWRDGMDDAADLLRARADDVAR